MRRLAGGREESPGAAFSRMMGMKEERSVRTARCRRCKGWAGGAVGGPELQGWAGADVPGQCGGWRGESGRVA